MILASISTLCPRCLVDEAFRPAPPFSSGAVGPNHSTRKTLPPDEAPGREGDGLLSGPDAEGARSGGEGEAADTGPQEVVDELVRGMVTEPVTGA